MPRILRERLHWRQLLLALICFSVPFISLRLVALTTDDDRVWESVASWPGDRDVRDIVVGGEGASTLLYAIGDAGGLYVSGDGAQTWRRAELSASSGFLGVMHLLDLAVHPTDACELYIALDSPSSNPRPMVYASRDGGLSWQVRGALGPKRVRALTFGPEPGDFYLAMSDRVINLHPSALDGGAVAASDKVLDALPGFELDPRFAISDLVVAGYPSAGDAERAIYIGTRDNGLRVYRGRAKSGYELVAPGLDSDSQYVRERARINQVCYHGANTAIVCVGTPNGLYASTDGGANWFRTAYALRHQEVTALLFGLHDDAIYVGVAGGGIYYSEDQGATWELLGQGLGRITPHALAFDGPDMLYAATDHGIWRLALTP